MASNRYYAKSTQEVFESYEWLMREILIQLDGLARNIKSDLQALRLADRDIRPMMQRFFAEMWEQVAETEEQKVKKSRGAGRGCGLSALTQAQKQA